MTALYTKRGDDGTTDLLGNERVEKFDLRIETLGTLDELSAALGLARSLCSDPLYHELKIIQVQLYELMTEVASTSENVAKFKKIDEKCVFTLEAKITEYSKEIIFPDGFIIPGDSTASAAISVARAITRRSERKIVELVYRDQIKNRELLKFINRLSSLLYVFEIYSIQCGLLKEISLAKEKES
ncbi:MAG: cob(I)yrinic acid a,c-diamide adenosyltransferase [Chloroflexi bacterium]|nr:cob(I)yrinic acid a,c-diamide adenosyltransferase [Chloroflexota bacterium]